MNEPTFVVRANPVLHEEGDLAGKLQYVRFTADRNGGIHCEWRIEATEIDKVLHSLENSGMRYEVLNHLHSGARISLPGVYTTGDLKNLGFQTTP